MPGHDKKKGHYSPHYREYTS